MDFSERDNLSGQQEFHEKEADEQSEIIVSVISFIAAFFFGAFTRIMWIVEKLFR